MAERLNVEATLMTHGTGTFGCPYESWIGIPCEFARDSHAQVRLHILDWHRNAIRADSVQGEHRRQPIARRARNRGPA